MSENISKEYCTNCKSQTNQETLLSTTSTHTSTLECTDPEIWVSTHSLNKIRKCLGCEHISFTRWQYDSEMDREFDSPTPEYFPPHSSRVKPQWHYRLEHEYQELVSEIYTSLANGTNRLTLMGCRTLVDMYLTDKVGDKGGFAQKLDKLYSENDISRENHATLKVAIDAGNAAAHRSYKPSNEVLNSVVSIVENLLEQQVLKGSAEFVAKKTPARKKTASKKKASKKTASVSTKKKAARSKIKTS